MPTTRSWAKACSSTSGRWWRRAARRSRCPSRFVRSRSGCSASRPSKASKVQGSMSARVVLGVGAGIAAYKACELLRLLTESGHQVRVVPTEAALRFVGAPTWEALSGQPVATSVWANVPDVEHVRLGQSADLILVVPATAD